MMAHMPDIEAEALAAIARGEHRIAGVVRHGLHLIRPDTSAATAAARTNQGDTMTTPQQHETFEQHVENFLTEVRTVGSEFIAKGRTIMSSPEGGEILATTHNLVTWIAAGIIPPSVLSSALAGLKGFEALAQGYVTAAQQAQQQAAEAPAAQ